MSHGLPRRRARGTTAQRGYGAAWQRLAAQAKRLQPWCSVCRATEDLVADHLRPETRGRQGLTLADVQVLCRRCNGSKQDKAAPRPTEQPRLRFSRSILK